MTAPSSTATPWRALAGPVRYRLGQTLRVDRAEMLRYLGYAGQDMDDGLAARIERVARTVEDESQARGICQVFGVEKRPHAQTGAPSVHLTGTVVELTGGSVRRHLDGACAAAVLAVTLGAENERRLGTLARTDPLEAALYDAASSALVEAAADAIDAALGADAGAHGLTRNGRFSPGYGDCPLTAQRPLVDALDATRAIGLTVTPTGLLVPQKSITAFIGLFDGEGTPRDAARTCARCALIKDCSFRKRGARCYR